MKPILSIIIPTKNRYYYLSYLVDYFHGIEECDIELIIQDNSDDISEKKVFVEKLFMLDDNRIKYQYEQNELSVIENSDRALLAATGEYVCYIGDDDIFSKHLITYVRKAKAKNIDAILPLKFSYNWPDIKSRFYGDKLSGKFSTKDFSGLEKRVSSDEILNRLLYVGGCDILNLPRVYHGIVKHDILREVFKITGSYFPGPSPDMANATALALFVKNMVEVDIPLIVSGHSVKSGGGMGASGKHIGEISNYKHLPKNTAEVWTAEIPFYWSGYTIYAESVMQALKRLNRLDLVAKFNFNYLYATCLVFDSSFKKRIDESIKKSKVKNYNISELKIKFYYFQIWKNRLLHHLKTTAQVALASKASKKIFELENILLVAEKNDTIIEETIPNLFVVNLKNEN